ncbi:MAG: hypothetical protein DCC49_12930 [Acidobacteria bacterium]|nr:MAG: hypothetical protein DCC49_12930 [Acidobacteriota bacterium]
MVATQLDVILENRSHVRVLRALHRLPDGFAASGREVARRSGVSHPTASKVLAMLAALGILDVARGASADAYELNREHFLATALGELFKTEAAEFEMLVRFLASELSAIGEIESAFLFGSVADGTASVSSDVDVAVHAPGLSESQIETALSDLSDRTQRRFGRQLGYIFSIQRRRPSRGAWATATTDGIALIQAGEASPN